MPPTSLLPRKISNLLVAGRCHSASKLAASSTRVTVTAMAMGQAAYLGYSVIPIAEKLNPGAVEQFRPYLFF